MGRTLTEAEKVARAARRMEKKERTELGPLFESQAVPVDERALMYERRRGTARGVEQLHANLDSQYVLGALEAMHLSRLAAEVIPAETHKRLDAYCRDTYPESYRAGFWRGVLAGKRVVFSFRRVPDATTTTGFRVVEDGVFPPEGWAPPFTPEQARDHYWSLCRDCGLWHAPGQAGCAEASRPSPPLPLLGNASVA